MFLITLITLAYCSSVALSNSCYYCQNFEFQHEFYDADCVNDQYSGHTMKCAEGHNCFTDVYEDGRFHRACGIIMDGVKCINHKYPHTTQCFCEGDLCNNGVCTECIDATTTAPGITTTAPDILTTTPDNPTTTPDVPTTTPDVPTTTPDVPTTTPDVPSTTTDVPTTTPDVPTTTTDVPTTTPDVPTTTPDVPTTTPDVPSTTPDVPSTTPDVPTTTPDVPTTTPDIPTITTTRIEIVGINCYDCQDGHPDWPENYDETCSNVGYDGLTYNCDNCGSCFTEIHDDGTIVRGESGALIDECAYSEGFKTCYCTKDLCNNQLCDQCTGIE